MDWTQFALAAGVLVSFVLHYFATKNHSTLAGKVADLIDQAEGALKK